MNVIYYLIPVAILFVIVGVIAFFWATKTEQFEDLEKQGLSILMDDDELQIKKTEQDPKS
jgi:cbb3-type cytochrome oxidase maturation protein